VFCSLCINEELHHSLAQPILWRLLIGIFGFNRKLGRRRLPWQKTLQQVSNRSGYTHHQLGSIEVLTIRKHPCFIYKDKIQCWRWHKRQPNAVSFLHIWSQNRRWVTGSGGSPDGEVFLVDSFLPHTKCGSSALLNACPVARPIHWDSPTSKQLVFKLTRIQVLNLSPNIELPVTFLHCGHHLLSRFNCVDSSLSHVKVAITVGKGYLLR